MNWDESKVLAKIDGMDDDELLDQVTAYRAGMEPEAVALMERELHRRGVNAAKIADHREACERECLFDAAGTALVCSFCRKPAVTQGWGWHKIMGVVPVLPRWLRRCKKHAAAPLCV